MLQLHEIDWLIDWFPFQRIYLLASTPLFWLIDRLISGYLNLYPCFNLMHLIDWLVDWLVTGLSYLYSCFSSLIWWIDSLTTLSSFVADWLIDGYPFVSYLYSYLHLQFKWMNSVDWLIDWLIDRSIDRLLVSQILLVLASFHSNFSDIRGSAKKSIKWLRKINLNSWDWLDR